MIPQELLKNNGNSSGFRTNIFLCQSYYNWHNFDFNFLLIFRFLNTFQDRSFLEWRLLHFIMLLHDSKSFLLYTLKHRWDWTFEWCQTRKSVASVDFWVEISFERLRKRKEWNKTTYLIHKIEVCRNKFW